MNKLKISLIEVAVFSAIILIISRYIWARELAEFEDAIFESLGLGGLAKSLIIAPLIILWFYSLYRKENRKGIKAVRWPIAIFAGVTFLGVILYLNFVVAG